LNTIKVSAAQDGNKAARETEGYEPLAEESGRTAGNPRFFREKE